MYDAVNENFSQPSEKIAGWDKLIMEARDQVKALNRAIEHFEENKAKGEPYFGEQGE